MLPELSIIMCLMCEQSGIKQVSGVGIIVAICFTAKMQLIDNSASYSTKTMLIFIHFVYMLD